MQQIANSSIRVFSISELGRSIIGLLSRKDRTRLARVSRIFYHAAIPMIWAHVDSSFALLSLLPLNETERTTDESGRIKTRVVSDRYLCVRIGIRITYQSSRSCSNH
jgi:hypothetical protein